MQVIIKTRDMDEIVKKDPRLQNKRIIAKGKRQRKRSHED